MKLCIHVRPRDDGNRHWDVFETAPLVRKTHLGEMNKAEAFLAHKRTRNFTGAIEARVAAMTACCEAVPTTKASDRGDCRDVRPMADALVTSAVWRESRRPRVGEGWAA